MALAFTKRICLTFLSGLAKTATRRTKKYEGTGIGLFLAKELIELQGGTIKVESTYGKGSTFTVCLPSEKWS